MAVVETPPAQLVGIDRCQLSSNTVAFGVTAQAQRRKARQIAGYDGYSNESSR